MRWSSAQRRRTSNTEPIYAPFFSYRWTDSCRFLVWCWCFYDARNISTARPRPGKGTYRETPTSYRTIRVDDSPSFTEKPGRKTRQRSCCCTGFLPHPGCSSLSSPSFPIAITLSRRIIRLRAQRLARPEKVRVHVRSHRRNHESLHGSSWLPRYALTCRITAAPWVFAWSWFIRSESRRSSFRTPLRTMKVSERFGKHAGPFGRSLLQ